MLDKETRTAIVALAGKERSYSEIARALKVSVNSVKRILREGTVEVAAMKRTSQLDDYLDDIRALYVRCKDDKGRTNRVRVYEELEAQFKREGKKLDASYSALT